mgnify:CR=1 FL=1
MPFVVTENCIKCKHTDCVEVCPVDCFHEGPNFLVIDPDECIDCTLCEPECPVNAIYPEEDVPAGQEPFVALNAELAKSWPVLATRKDAPADAAEWDGRLGPVPGQWHQTGAFTACQHDGKNLWVLRHGNSSLRASCDTVRTVGPLHHETAYAHYDCINSANRKEFAARVLKISSSFQQRFTMRSCASHA